jgi:aspartyl-tRNA synthetase
VLRSHAAGSLRSTDAGQTVTLAGWVARRRDHGGVIFIDLRDGSGVSQVVFRDAGVLEQAHRLRSEFCVAVTGVVEARPEGNANADIATGDIEVNATTLTVLGESAPLPFQLDETPGERASSTATWTCAARVPVRRSGCGPRSTPRPAGCSPATTSSRSRRRR